MDIISKNFNLEHLQQEFKETGAVVIKDLLCDDVAEAVYESLEKGVPWELHSKKPKIGGEVIIINPEETLKLTAKEKLKLVPRILTLQDNDLSFVYNRFTIPTTEKDACEYSLILAQVAQYFNSKEYLQLLGDITGDHRGQELSIWASRYDPNHHLSVHHDESRYQGRIAAHVLGLTKNWKKEWGGNFAFCNDQGKPVDYHMPRFNCLTMFKVPRLHLVSQIKPYAQEFRYSFFGWYKVRKEYF